MVINTLTSQIKSGAKETPKLGRDISQTDTDRAQEMLVPYITKAEIQKAVGVHNKVANIEKMLAHVQGPEVSKPITKADHLEKYHNFLEKVTRGYNGRK